MSCGRPLRRSATAARPKARHGENGSAVDEEMPPSPPHHGSSSAGREHRDGDRLRDKHRPTTDGQYLYRDDGCAPCRPVEPRDELGRDDRQRRQEREENQRDGVNHPLAKAVDLVFARDSDNTGKPSEVSTWLTFF